ncbi:MAG: hypothetical protein H6Q75_1587 [Firmicutes bacterium]|nr:hypothetical protein [Bacillota bacterium]
MKMIYILGFLTWMILHLLTGFYFLRSAFTTNKDNIIKENPTSFIVINYSLKTKKVLVIITRIICIALAFVLFIASIPYFRDLPLLLTYKLSYIEGPMAYSAKRSRGFDINREFNGVIIHFSFTSTMDKNKIYRVGYLPNTHTGISIAEVPR